MDPIEDTNLFTYVLWDKRTDSKVFAEDILSHMAYFARLAVPATSDYAPDDIFEIRRTSDGSVVEGWVDQTFDPNGETTMAYLAIQMSDLQKQQAYLYEHHLRMAALERARREGGF